MEYVNSVMNFTGNKFKLLDQLIPELDTSKDYFVDLFCGGGSIYINVAHLYKKILVNDIITDLIGIHKGLLESDNIIFKTKELCPNKDDAAAYDNLRNSYNANKSPEKLWALMMSCTNNFMRFNKSFKFNQTFGKRSWSEATDKKVEKLTEHIRQYKDKFIFVSKNFYDVKITKPSMVYCDPPYYNSEAGYNAYWSLSHEKKLYNYLIDLDKNGSSFMISGVISHDGVDSELLEKLSKNFKCKELQYDYNKVSRKGDKDTTEVIIKNY